MSNDRDEAARAVHEAIKGYLDDGEFPITWILTVDVAGPDGTRYLAHRAGSGFDGTEKPQVWTAVGLIEAERQWGRTQLDMISPPLDDDEEEEDE